MGNSQIIHQTRTEQGFAIMDKDGNYFKFNKYGVPSVVLRLSHARIYDTIGEARKKHNSLLNGKRKYKKAEGCVIISVKAEFETNIVNHD